MALQLFTGQSSDVVQANMNLLVNAINSLPVSSGVPGYQPFISPLDPQFGGVGADASVCINAAVQYTIANNLALDLRGAPNGSWFIKHSVYLFDPATGNTVQGLVSDCTGTISAATNGVYDASTAVLLGDPFNSRSNRASSAVQFAHSGQLRIYSNSRTSSTCQNGIYFKGYDNLLDQIYPYNFPGSAFICDNGQDTTITRVIVENGGSFATFTGAIAPAAATATSWSIINNVLTISGTIIGAFVPGSRLTGTGISGTLVIASQLTGTQYGAGTYRVAPVGSIAGSGTLTCSYGLLATSSFTGNLLGCGSRIFGSGVTASTVVTYADATYTVVYPSQTVGSVSMTGGSFACWIGDNWLRGLSDTADSTNAMRINAISCNFAAQWGLWIGSMYRDEIGEIHAEQCQVLSTTDGNPYISGGYVNHYIGGDVNGLNTFDISNLEIDAYTATGLGGASKDGFFTIAALNLSAYINGGTAVSYRNFDMIGGNTNGTTVTTGGGPFAMYDSQMYAMNQFSTTGQNFSWVLQNCYIPNTLTVKVNTEIIGCDINLLANHSATEEVHVRGGSITTVNMTQAINGNITFAGTKISTVDLIGAGPAAGFAAPVFSDCTIATLVGGTNTVLNFEGGLIGSMSGTIASSTFRFRSVGFTTFNPNHTNYITDQGCYATTVSSWGVPTVTTFNAGEMTYLLGSEAASANIFKCSSAVTPTWTAIA